MDKLSQSLYFPSLVRTGNVANSQQLYSLDWGSKDKYVHSMRPLMKAAKADLPPGYEQWLDGFVYCLSNEYIEEIRRNANLAKAEWSRERSFDTNIREMCLETAIAATRVSFGLLADCVYDTAGKYWYRGNDKIIIEHALLYKFWVGQTGSGLYREHANFDRLTKYITLYAGFGNLETRQCVERFINDVELHEKRSV